jgi:hypothetical protein
VNTPAFDGNGSLPASSSGTIPGVVTGVSTNNADDLLIYSFVTTTQPGSSFPPPAGWTVIVEQTDFSDVANFCTQVVGCLSVSSTQSSITVTGGGSSGSPCSTIVDALTADGPAEVDLVANMAIGLTETVSMVGGVIVTGALNLSLANNDVILRLASAAVGPNDVTMYVPSAMILGLSEKFALSGTAEVDMPYVNMALGITEAIAGNAPDVNTINLPSTMAIGIGESVSVSGGTVRIPVVVVIIT